MSKVIAWKQCGGISLLSLREKYEGLNKISEATKEHWNRQKSYSTQISQLYHPLVAYGMGSPCATIDLSARPGGDRMRRILYIIIFILITTSFFTPITFSLTQDDFQDAVSYSVGDRPTSVFAIDLNNDGYNDIITANDNDNKISVLKNNGDGTFANKVDYNAGNGAISVFSTDVNNDGYNDIITANGNGNTVSVLKNKGDGTFYSPIEYSSSGSAVSVFLIDLDNDTDKDIITTNWNVDKISVFKNNGDGTFGNRVDYDVGDDPRSVFSIDLDGDGDNDIITANNGDDKISILKNNGNGTFSNRIDYSVVDGPWCVFSVDLDSDDDNDIIVANRWFTNKVSVFKNNGDGTFANKVDYEVGNSPHSVFAIDLDFDMDNDIITANSGSDTVSILENNGNGTFKPQITFNVGDFPRSVFSIDINNDGDNDIITADENSDAVSILKNIYGNPKSVDLQIQDINEDSVNLSWSKNKDEDFSKYEVHVSTEENFTPNSSTLVANITNRNTTNYTVENLTEGDTYYFKVRVVDSSGLYNDSNEESATTIPEFNSFLIPIISLIALFLIIRRIKIKLS